VTQLRPYQSKIKQDVFDAWQRGARNVLVKSPTGSGKTVITGSIINTVGGAVASIAHRSELISQKSVALAREGVRHRIIGPDSLRKNCVTLQMQELGRTFYDAGARVGVCSVDTLPGFKKSNDSWFAQVGLWDMDEAHHVLRSNKWGAAVEMFPNARGLGVTATPARADGRGLGVTAEGVFDLMVDGPEMRELIDDGYLTDYKIFAPPSDVDYSDVTVTASGDLSPAKLRAAVHASDTFVGDVVSKYLEISNSRLGRLGRGITFAVDIEAAEEINAAYRAAGVPSEIVTGKTPDLLRNAIMGKFRAGTVKQLVNVDLFGEGVDIPACEIVSMARKTESWPLYVQQFGRALRLMIDVAVARGWDAFSSAERLGFIAASAKPVAYIIDHAGNVFRHGLPDAQRVDTLFGRGVGAANASDAIPTRICTNSNVGGVGLVCGHTYERFYKACPFCGFYPEPQARTAPQFVDGDLFELDEATLRTLRGIVAKVDGPCLVPSGLGEVAAYKVRANHLARTEAQSDMRAMMDLWAGWQRARGFDDSQRLRLFYHTFGVDVLTAQALGAREATELRGRIETVLNQHGVITK
jgi:DNA repair protein RadD